VNVVHITERQIMIARKTKTHVRKRQITKAALDILNKKGLEGLTIGSIAKKTRMTNSNVYRHFAGKGAIVGAVIERVGMALQKFVQAAGKNRTPLESLEEIFMSHIKFIERNRYYPQIIFSEKMYRAGPEISGELNRYMMGYFDKIKAILRLGIQCRSFSEGLDTDAAADVFVGLIQSIAMRWVISGYRCSPSKKGANVWQIFLRGILTRH
jgi:AcrR family transcriptional regulator